MTQNGNGDGPVRVTHVATGLGVGGAELMLHKVLSELDRDRFAPAVISLSDVGVIGERIQALGVPVEAVGLRSGTVTPAGALRLGRLLRRRRPAVVQTWMYHADFLGGLMARTATDAPVIWGLRGSIDRKASAWHTVAVTDACARLSSRVPRRILSCSHELAELHGDWGYDRSRMTVIPNGFDVDRLRPDPGAGSSLREELGLPESSVLIGLPARFDAQKDHATFARAAGRIRSERDDVRFVLCGNDIEPANAELSAMIAREGIEDRVELLGRRDDMPRLMAGFDVVVSSSAFGEGFSNVIGEAMACGTPCAATDVGDARVIIGDTGRAVPRRDPEALAEAITALLDAGAEGRAELGRRARSRIVDQYALPSVVRRYEQLYLDVLS